MREPGSWPTHAYIPGQTPRHPDGCFDALRNTARPGSTVAELADCAAFRTGLRYIDAGFYWEAHELLEPVWMALPKAGADRRLVQGLIQLANGFLKLRMDRANAALRLARIARDLIPDPEAGMLMTIDLNEMHRRIDSLEEAASCAL